MTDLSDEEVDLHASLTKSMKLYKINGKYYSLNS